MGIFGRSAEKKRAKAIHQEAKELMKELVNAGMDKRTVKNRLEVLEELAAAACTQRENYIESKKRMASGQMIMENLLDEIAGKEPGKVREQLTKLAGELSDVFHECTIRKDDKDFVTTYTYISRAAKEYEGTDRLMLQSELENLLHLVKEVIEWDEPDFCALAFFCKYGNRAELPDIENCQRNEMLMQYYCEQYWDKFEKELTAAGMEKRVKEWIEEKVK